MRAKTINHTKCAVFDLDDCLIKSEGLVYAYEDEKFTRTLTPQEYSTYVKKPNEVLDFSDFRDGDLILSAPKHRGWEILEKIYFEEDIDIFILTARSPALKPYIWQMLMNNEININIDHIITIGDDKGDVDIAATKRKILKEMAKEYEQILFFDDDMKNIRLAASVPGVKTKLIESLFKRGINPLDAMSIGDVEGRKIKGITSLLSEFDLELIKIESDANSTTIIFKGKEMKKGIFAIYQDVEGTFYHEFSWKTLDGIWHYQTSRTVKKNNILRLLRGRLRLYKFDPQNSKTRGVKTYN
jgi:FMN phosphatase YigB (HAD superfamily)